MGGGEESCDSGFFFFLPYAEGKKPKSFFKIRECTKYD